MPLIGRNHPLVNLLHAKTKIKKGDIIDMLKVMPECMAEHFMLSNVDEGERVEMGGIAISWHSGGKWGSWLAVKTNAQFRRRIADLKMAKSNELAVKLNELMHPKNKESYLNRVSRESLKDLS